MLNSANYQELRRLQYFMIRPDSLGQCGERLIAFHIHVRTHRGCLNLRAHFNFKKALN